MSPRPKHLRLRAYQVGFGDCLLLTVTYGSAFADGRKQRHMLIDFGSKEQRGGGPTMGDIAQVISDHCSAQLDVVVATHRHQDHIKGFGDRTASALLDELHPKVVVRPWTDIAEAADPGDVHFAAWQGLDSRSREFALVLEGTHTQAQAVNETFALDESAIAKRARVLADLGLKNTRAVATLESWATREGSHGAWVRAGDQVDLESVMPGIDVRVLGPPTLEQVPQLTSYARVSQEYWLALAEAAELGPHLAPPEDGSVTDAFEVLAQPGGGGAAAWLLRQLRGQQRDQVLRIVEGFDNVLNNTSIILHVTVGRRILLFAGDAQVENWSYTLDRAYGTNDRPLDKKLRKLLRDVEVYKVGHHGSRNATPIRLYDLWADRDPSTNPVVSVLTSMAGVYEKSEEGAVPKLELVDGLKLIGPVHSTEDLADDVWWFDLSAPTSGAADYTYTPGEPVG